MTDTRRRSRRASGWDGLAVAIGELFSPPAARGRRHRDRRLDECPPAPARTSVGLVVLVFVCGLPYAVIIRGV